MKVTMINDCAFVGETLLKYLPAQLEKEQIKRSRGLWSKTFGLTYKILRSKADLYHAHYLLQDCYIASRLGKKPLIGHAHGSDLRVSIKHPVWGRIVRHNLKNCAAVLVSTPDVLGIAEKFRKDSEYLANPVNEELFFPKPFLVRGTTKRVLIASDSNWIVKGTETAVKALSMIKDEVQVSIIRHGVDFDKTVALASSLGLKLNILPKVPHEKLNEYFWNADVVLDRFTLGSLGVVSLEAIACGRPVIAYVSSEYPQYEDFPMKNVHDEGQIAEAVRKSSEALWQQEHAYFTKHHSYRVIIPRLMQIYSEQVKEAL